LNHPDIDKAIELYLKRQPDFMFEVNLVKEKDKDPYIKEWNAKEKKPTEKELEMLLKDNPDYIMIHVKEDLIRQKEAEILRRQAIQELQAENKLEADYGKDLRN